MKTTMFISLSFIISVLSANSAPGSVLDVTGKKLRAGVNYYVMPASREGRGGGIIPGAIGPNNTCPLGVTQLRTDKYGPPLTFTPFNSNKGVIRLSTDVNIKFSGSTSCNQSNVWKLNYDNAKKQYFVLVGGVEGNPGRKTMDNWFKIEKTKDGYKFVFCPSVCHFCKVICRDVGIYLGDHGLRRLALTLSDVPFSVIFER